MSGVGGVSGAGSAAGAGSVEAAPSSSSLTKSGSASEKGSSHGTAEPMCSAGHNMSTQNFIELHNTAITQANEVQSSDIDLKKLIEMMMAIELLKAMDEQ
jgi:hypothetical protein